MMKILYDMPTEGQFVAVWEHNGKTWSDTHKIEDGDLFRISDKSEVEFKWEAREEDRDFYNDADVVFIVME